MSRTTCFIVLSGVLTLAARTAGAHALLTTPMPRDQQDGYKDPPRTPPGTGAPCGVSEAASQPHNTLTAGAAMTVNWNETTTHPGCFVIDFSPAGDANFVTLAVKSHMNAPTPTNPTKANPRKWSVGVTLPSAPCTKCTLRLRQLMLPSDVTDAKCPPATIPDGATYYSCANVALTGGTTGAAGAGGSGAGTGGRGGGSAGSTGRGGSGAAGTTGAAGAVSTGAAGTTGAAGSTAPGRGGDVGGPAGETGSTGVAGSTVDPTGVAGSTSGAAGSTVDPSGAAGSTGNPSGAGGVTAPPTPESSAGCNMAGGTSPASLLALVGLGLLLSRRRYRRSRF